MGDVDLAAVVKRVSEETGVPLSYVEITFRFGDGGFFYTVTIAKQGKRPNLSVHDESLEQAVASLLQDWKDPEGAPKRRQVEAMVPILVEAGMDEATARERATQRIFGNS